MTTKSTSMPRAAAGRFSGPRDGAVCWETEVGHHVVRLAWSPDGRVLAAACAEGPIHVVHAATGLLLRILEGHRSGTTSLCWTHDGRLLASGGRDGKVRIWHINSERPRLTLDAGSSLLTGVAYAPDTYLLASSAGPYLKLWGPQGECLRVYSPHPGAISDIHWQQDGFFLATACDGQLAIFKPWSPTPLQAFPCAGSLLCVAWSTDGNFAAAATEDAGVHLWDRRSGTEFSCRNV